MWERPRFIIPPLGSYHQDFLINALLDICLSQDSEDQVDNQVKLEA